MWQLKDHSTVPLGGERDGKRSNLFCGVFDARFIAHYYYDVKYLKGVWQCLEN
jgi:hypothetical protein